MLQVNIHEAKAHLSKIVDRAANGEEFIIAKAGKPMVKVIPISTTQKPKRVGGFLKGHATIPDDIDTMGNEEIAAIFENIK